MINFVVFMTMILNFKILKLSYTVRSTFKLVFKLVFKMFKFKIKTKKIID